MQSVSKSTRMMSKRSSIRTYNTPQRPHTPTPFNTVHNYIVPNDITIAIKDAEESVKKGDLRMAAVKWDIVDELWTHYIHQENRKNIYEKMDALDAYCSVEMDALECREYDL